MGEGRTAVVWDSPIRYTVVVEALQGGRKRMEARPMRMLFNVRTLVVAFTVAVVVYAIRSGQPEGRFLGVPYDFRVPTIDRIRRRWWNRDDGRIFMPCAFGIGWALNLFQLAEKFRADNAVGVYAEARESILPVSKGLDTSA